jgi:hypothetical protein
LPRGWARVRITRVATTFADKKPTTGMVWVASPRTSWTRLPGPSEGRFVDPAMSIISHAAAEFMKDVLGAVAAELRFE